MGKIPYYVEIINAKCKCRICSKEVECDELEIFQLRGQIRGVCKECMDKIVGFIEELEKED